MNLFKDLSEAGVCNTNNYILTECMKFVFKTLIQREFDVICDATDATIRPTGRPDVIYCTYSDNYLHPVNHQDIDRSSPPEMFLGKGVLKIFSKFTGKHPCRHLIC